MLIKLVMALALPVLSAGALLLYVFRKVRLPVFFLLALSYALGMGILSIWMMFLGFFGLPYTWQFIGLPLLLNFTIFSSLIVLKRTASEKPSLLLKRESQPALSLSKSSKILLRLFCFILACYIALNIYHIFWRALNLPVYTWDAIATVAFKAKIFYTEQSLFKLDQLPHANYPLFVPFLETWVAINLGEWHEQLVKIIFPFGCASFMILCFYFLDYYTNKAWALLGLALILSSNLFVMHSSISYRDFYVMYYACLSVVCLLLWARTRHAGLMWIAGFFGGVTSFVKVEGSAYLVILLVVVTYLLFILKDLDLKKKFLNGLSYGIPSIFILLSFHLYKIFFTSLKLTGNEEKEKITFALEHLGRIPETIAAYFHCLFMQSNWGITWFIFAFSLVHFIRRKKTEEKQILLLSLCLFFLLYIAVAVATASYRWLVGPERISGLARIFLHFFPLAPLFIILTNYEPNFLGGTPKEKPAAQPIPNPNRPKKKKRRKK